MQGLWVQSWVGELRSHIPHGQENQSIKQQQYYNKFSKDFKQTNKKQLITTKRTGESKSTVIVFKPWLCSHMTSAFSPMAFLEGHLKSRLTHFLGPSGCNDLATVPAQGFRRHWVQLQTFTNVGPHGLNLCLWISYSASNSSSLSIIMGLSCSLALANMIDLRMRR